MIQNSSLKTLNNDYMSPEFAYKPINKSIKEIQISNSTSHNVSAINIEKVEKPIEISQSKINMMNVMEMEFKSREPS